MNSIETVHAPESHRYELRDGVEVIGFAHYRPQDGGATLAFDHTEVHEGYSGLGLAARLVAFALDDVRAAGLKIRPFCPYVAAYVRRHPEMADLVVE